MNERPKSPEQNSPQEPRALLAKDVDFSELARRTWGEIYDSPEDGTTITWGNSELRWGEKEDGSGRTLIMREKLHDMPGCENYGLVMGENYAALMYPGGKDEKVLGGELIFHGSVRYFSGPAEMYLPVFAEATKLGNESTKEQPKNPDPNEVVEEGLLNASRRALSRLQGGVVVPDKTIIIGGEEQEDIVVGGDELLKDKHSSS